MPRVIKLFFVIPPHSSSSEALSYSLKIYDKVYRLADDRDAWGQMTTVGLTNILVLKMAHE